MKRTGTTILLALLMGLLTTPSQASTLLGDYLKEKGIEVTVSSSVDVYDKYVWRGFLLDDDTVLQPAVTLAAMGFEGGYWGSWDLENDDALASDESDGWLGYTNNLGFISEDLAIVKFKFGNTWYAFPEASTYTKESYLGLSLDTFLAPYFIWYHDYGKESQGGGDGDYFNIGVGHSITLSEEYGIMLNLGQEIGFNNDAFIKGDGGYSLTSASVTLPLSDHVTLTPKIAYSAPWGDLEDDTSNGGINQQDDQFYGGASMAFAF